MRNGDNSLLANIFTFSHPNWTYHFPFHTAKVDAYQKATRPSDNSLYKINLRRTKGRQPAYINNVLRPRWPTTESWTVTPKHTKSESYMRRPHLLFMTNDNSNRHQNFRAGKSRKNPRQVWKNPRKLRKSRTKTCAFMDRTRSQD